MVFITYARVVSDNEWTGWLRWMKSAFRHGMCLIEQMFMFALCQVNELVTRH
jgi:hypothetical protein